MPVSALKGLAKKYKLSVSTVERYWHECKESVGNAPRKYKRIMGCVVKRCKNKTS